MSTSSSAQNVFGSGLAVGLGYEFDPKEFFKRPATILRIISWFFSIIVFGCISSGCYAESKCIFAEDSNACGYGIFVGSLAFVICMASLVADAFFERLSSAQLRKYVVLADIAISSTWTFFYFVAFCYLTNRLINTPESVLHQLSVQPWQLSNARASISFIFFSIGTFAALIYFAVQRYRQGLQNAFPPSGQIESQVASGDYQQQPYQSGLPNPESGFQAPPFSGASDRPADTAEQYKPPVY